MHRCKLGEVVNEQEEEETCICKLGVVVMGTCMVVVEEMDTYRVEEEICTCRLGVVEMGTYMVVVEEKGTCMVVEVM
ncbi:hypothetical protein L9G74_20405, partial [Shewanella sp. C32]|nr:hypothetical protein [Shewanella electrica]